MGRLGLVVALLAPAAVAQQITITSSFAATFNTGQTPTVNIGKTLCVPDQSIDFRYDLGVIPTAGVDTVEAWIVKDSSKCASTTDPDAPSQQLAVPSQSSQTGLIVLHPRVNELLFPDSVFSGGCANTTSRASSPFTEFFCVRRKTAAVFGGNPTINSATLQVNFALLPPAAPSRPTATPGDSHVQLDWTSNDSGDRFYDVYVVPTGTAPDTGKYTAHNLSTTHADVDHDSDGTSLRNGTVYDAYVRSIDGYQNTSPLSTRTPIEPVLIEDFYTRYRNHGGSASGGGGCATGGEAGVLAFCALLVAAARRKRRKALVAAAALVAVAPAARAADWTGLDRPERRWLVAFKIDRYDPQIDSERTLVAAGQQPYHDIFHGRAPLRYQLEVDYQPLHPFGAVLVGGTLGYWQNVGHGIYASDYTDPDTQVVHRAGEASGDGARLDVIPLGAILTYRFDWLADRYRWLPIVPYAQAGLQTALWVSYNGNGNVPSPSGGGRGSGWSYGYTTALGVAVDLGAIDADLARESYVSTTIQRTAVFAEYGWTRLNNFGRSGALILSDRAWRFGLSVEF